jgi:hypothetical protein
MSANALLTGKKQLVKISDEGAKPTVFCPCLTACYVETASYC